MSAAFIAASVLTAQTALSAPSTVGEVLRNVGRIYSGLEDYHIVAVRDGVIVDDHSVPPRRSVITLDANGGGRVRVSLTGEGHDVLVVTDGKTTWHYSPGKNEYSLTATAPLRAGLEGHISNQTSLLDQMRDLLVGRYSKLWEFEKEATFDGVEEINFQGRKIPCYLVTFHLGALTDKLWINQSNYLVMQEESVQPLATAGNRFQWSDTIHVSEIDIRRTRPKDYFTFAPPAAAARVDTLILPYVQDDFIGASAGEFTLEDTEGKQISLSDFRGKTVVLSFWATWCLPCQAEMPTIQKVYEQHKDDVVVLAVDDENEATVKNFLKVNHYGFTALVDSDRTLFKNYAVHFIPTVLVINAEGMIVRQIVGWEGPQELLAALDASEHWGSATGAP